MKSSLLSVEAIDYDCNYVIQV